MIEMYVLEGKEFASKGKIAEHFGVSFTAIKNHLIFHDDGNVTYKKPGTDLRNLRKRRKSTLDSVTYTYDGVEFTGYDGLSRYVGIPISKLRIGISSADEIDDFVGKYRLENYPYVVRGVRYPSALAIAKHYKIRPAVLMGGTLDSASLEARLDEHLRKLEDADSGESAIMFNGESFESLMDVSLAYNLDIRSLLYAYRDGVALETVTQPGLWGLDNERSKAFTPRRFYELNKNQKQSDGTGFLVDLDGREENSEYEDE